MGIRQVMPVVPIGYCYLDGNGWVGRLMGILL